MPCKNAIKDYKKNSFYHIYNRGVEKRKVFLEEQDYKVFHHYLSEKSRLIGASIVDHVYVGNHYHLIVFQEGERDIERLMRSAMVRYVRYFNSKYNRVGPLFQGRYRALRVTSMVQLKTLLKYLEKNRVEDEGLSLT